MNRSLILNILSSLPSKREAQSFLRKVKLRQDGTLLAPPISSIGLLLLQDTSILNRKSDAVLVANSLSELCQLGIQPLVILDSSLTAAPATSKPMTMSKWSRINAAFQLAEQIDICEGQVRGIPIYSDFAEGYESSAEQNDHHLLSESKATTNLKLDLSQIKTHLSNGQVPILVPIAFHQESVKSTLIPSRTLLISLCRALAADKDLGPPVKLIVINKNGGLRSLEYPHKHQGFVNLNPAYITSLSWLKSTEWSNLNETINTIDQVLGELPPTCSAIMASCYSQSGVISNLLTEKAPLENSAANFSPRLGHSTDNDNTNPSSHAALATSSIGDKKASIQITPPTMFRKGLSLATFTSLSDPNLNIPSLTGLIESSFKRTLDTAPYYRRLEKSLAAIIIAGGDGYNGAVIVTHEHLSANPEGQPTMFYLDKFAVSPTSQGLGVADLLWSSLVESFPDVVWRSRIDNPVNKWYFERAGGFVRAGPWIVFWWGAIGLEMVEGYVGAAGFVSPSFVPDTKE